MLAEDGGIKLRERTVPDLAFTARCLLRAARWGTLATSADGQPFASLVTHAVAPDGAALLLLSSLADHTQNLLASPRCALMVTGAPEGPNWQTAPRVTISGQAERLQEPSARAYWLARHPYARQYADFTDFTVWRLALEQAAFVGGFGQAAKLTAQQLHIERQTLDAVAAASESLITACNARRSDAISRIARAAGKRGVWCLLGVDTDGVDLVQDDDVFRVAFARPAASVAEVQASMDALLS